MKLNILIVFLLSIEILSGFGLQAQVPDSIVVSTDSLALPAPADTVRKTKVYLEHANTLSFDQAQNPDAQVLVGEVCFRHDSSYMYCDSAYFFEKSNSLEAFSHVRME